MAKDAVAAFRRPVAPCPACGEAQHIEPLLRIGPVWYLRCLNCQFGLRMHAHVSMEFRERRSNGERRATPRGGQRTDDVVVEQPCPHCHANERRAWILTAEASWARCGQCGRVERQDRASAGNAVREAFKPIRREGHRPVPPKARAQPSTNFFSR